jgi:hypothetical protein
MKTNRCAARCDGCHRVSRRQFVATVSLASVSVLGGWLPMTGAAPAAPPAPTGPGARYVPKVKACFVRRKGEYGMRWPGQIYDGEAARKNYTRQIAETAKNIGIQLDLRPEPIYSGDEADAWIAEATAQSPDGLLVVLLDRQEHAWPTANKAVDSKIPTVIFSPIGSSFTTNTTEPSKKTGCFISSTDDFGQTAYGMKMLWTGAKMRESRCLVIKGGSRADGELAQLGLKLRTIPAKTFLEEYEKTPVDEQVRQMAAELIQGARKQTGATEEDVINGIKSYLVAETLLAREECDGITMDCLGALGRSKVSLPCIAWSKMNDLGIPAACEADLGAMASHVLVQYLFDRPGFQQDPVAETVREAIVGAHCSCATRLAGRSEPPEVYDIVHHHGQRDATARPLWKIGQRVTSVDVLPASEGQPAQMIISAGEVIDNVSAPPAGGCVVSVMVKFDDVSDVLAYPGFHQLFFYGDFKRELVAYCRLFNIEPVVV